MQIVIKTIQMRAAPWKLKSEFPSSQTVVSLIVKLNLHAWPFRVTKFLKF